MGKAGDVDIRIAVVIVIAHRHAHSIDAAAGNTGLLGDIGEGAIRILPVERVLAWSALDGKFVAAAVDQEDV